MNSRLLEIQSEIDSHLQAIIALRTEEAAIINECFRIPAPHFSKKPVVIKFHDSGHIEHEGKKHPLRGYRLGLLKTVYESESWSMTYDEVGAAVWGKNYFDIDQVIEVAKHVRRILKDAKIPLHVSTANGCITLVEKRPQTDPKATPNRP